MEPDRSLSTLITFRKATIKDRELLLEWANDPIVRKNSFNEHPITYGEHCRWFKEKLGSSVSTVFIIENDKQPIGQIRIDIKGPEGIINYSIDKRFRGMGYGTEILISIPEYLAAIVPHCMCLSGVVKINNVASISAFKKASFTEISRNKSTVTFKKIVRR